MPLIDLYSDTKTLPSNGMRTAMANAEVGDEQADEDPTTLILNSRVASLLGFSTGLFLPSGTMCNLVSILSHTRPGDEVICDESSHIYGTEAAGAAAIAGVSIRAIRSPYGVFESDQVTHALRAKSITAPQSRMLTIEQSTNFSGGAVWPLEVLRSVRDVALENNLKCHIDGARLLNACANSKIEPHVYTEGWHSAWIDLSKGLGCPVGAVLCGDDSFIRQAAQWKYRLGGAMRQSGILAAAGLYALDHHLERLVADQENALLIWCVLSHSNLFHFDPPEPTTNILRFSFDGDLNAHEFANLCLNNGVRVRVIDDWYIRVTTHLDVSSDEATLAATVMLKIAKKMQKKSTSLM